MEPIEQEKEMEKRRDYIAGLRVLANRLEAHPELRLPAEGQNRYSSLYFWFLERDGGKESLLHTAQALGIREFDKSYDESNFRVEGKLRGLCITLIAPRANVCTAHVVGKKLVKQKVPTGWEEKLVEVDDVVWECPPILAAEQAPTES